MKHFLFFFFLLLLGSCTPSINPECPSGIFNNDICCTYVCDKVCSQGFEPNTCNCVCLGGDFRGLDVFDSTSNINPPEIPS